MGSQPSALDSVRVSRAGERSTTLTAPPTTGCPPEPEAGCDGVRPGVHADLGWALATVLRAYARAADHAVAELPGGSRGYRLLAAAARDCPRSQLALAQHIGLDRTVVTYLLDDLTDAGLLRREPDPVDRRTRRVVATEAGTLHLDVLDRRLRAVEDHILTGLDPADRTLLRTLLQRVALTVAASADTADPTPSRPPR